MTASHRKPDVITRLPAEFHQAGTFGATWLDAGDRV
jgi:hypothetical protein